MKSQTKVLSIIVAMTLSGAAGWAWSTNNTDTPAAILTPIANTTTNGATPGTATTQGVFRVRFAATCQSFNANQGRIVTTRLTDKDIIAQATGGSAADASLTRNFALAYNAGEDSLQVVNASNLQPVVDVIHFGGGAAIADSRQLDRFTFLFFPGQTNELGAETNVFGSAVITERPHAGRRSGAAVPGILGRLQFVLSGTNALGMTNAFVSGGTTNGTATNATAAITGSATNATGMAGATNNPDIATVFPSAGNFVMINSNIVFDASARICVGTFSTAGAAPLTPFPTAPATGATNGVSTTNTNTTGTTNGTTGVSTTNGVTTATNTVVVVNPLTGATTMVPSTTVSTGTTGLFPPGTGTTGLGTSMGATPTGSGAITTGAGTIGLGTMGATGTTAATGTTTMTGVTGTTSTTGVPISTGF